ncbi:MAG: hypothetical protein IPO29_00240 [Anaerolineae bacterium]|nr:hypothetical protein [Anaerolineae bacterium]
MTTPHPLVAHSIAVIRANQAASGAYVASPSFGQYQACWFRDGSFIAHAMSVMGEADSASRFHDWAANVVLRHAGAARDCIARARAGQPLDPKRILNARYSLEGEDQGDDWPNFQLDGFGTWLWASIDHATRAGDTAAAARWRPAWDLVADYLGALWRLPNFDAWEEHGDKIHVTTLAALFGGLNTYAAATGSTVAARVAADIRAFVLTEGVQDGGCASSPASTRASTRPCWGRRCRMACCGSTTRSLGRRWPRSSAISRAGACIATPPTRITAGASGFCSRPGWAGTTLRRASPIRRPPVWPGSSARPTRTSTWPSRSMSTSSRPRNCPSGRPAGGRSPPRCCGRTRSI